MEKFLLNLKFIFKFIIYIIGELLAACDTSWILIAIGIALAIFFPVIRIILIIIFILYLIKNRESILEGIKIEKACMINEYKTFFENYEEKKKQAELFKRIHKEAKLEKANLRDTINTNNNTINNTTNNINSDSINNVPKKNNLFSSNIYSNVHISNNNNIKTFDYSVDWNIIKCDLPVKIVRVLIKDIPIKDISQVVTISNNGTQNRKSYKGTITIEEVYKNLIENN